jgi:hypothetical protein
MVGVNPPGSFDPVEALRVMLRIRLVEQALTQAWAHGAVPGEYHSGIGEEAIHVGVLSHLGVRDAVAADHRSTGPLVARGVDLTALMVEVMGGQTGLNSGWAGHMHLMDPELRVSADGIVGSSAPLAVGHALAAQQLRPGSVAVAFFGEGALNAGVVLEAINLAAVWRLPVVFVCKDNRWSITTRTAAVTAGEPRARVEAMGLPVLSVHGEKVDRVHQAADRLLRRARAGRGPALLYATCHRPGGHFEGDPLLRILHHPRAQAGELAPGLLAGVRASTGGARAERAAGLSTLSARLVSAAKDWGTSRHRDPVLHARRLVPAAVGDRVREEEHARVVDALSAALGALKAPETPASEAEP